MLLRPDSKASVASTWSPLGSCRPQVGPIFAPRSLLSGEIVARLSADKAQFANNLYPYWYVVMTWQYTELAVVWSLELHDKEVAFNRMDADIACTPLRKSNGTIFFRHKLFILYFLFFILVFIRDIRQVVNMIYANFYWISLCDFKVSLVTSQWHFEKGN